MSLERYWNSNSTNKGNYQIVYTKSKRLSAKEQVEQLRNEKLFNALWVIETYYSRK
jgi:hypothetical protein